MGAAHNSRGRGSLSRSLSHSSKKQSHFPKNIASSTTSFIVGQMPFFVAQKLSCAGDTFYAVCLCGVSAAAAFATSNCLSGGGSSPFVAQLTLFRSRTTGNKSAFGCCFCCCSLFHNERNGRSNESSSSSSSSFPFL
jgi:hypothetical protein